MKLRVLSLAETDVMDAALWYEYQQNGLGFRFWSAVDVAYQLIREDPERFPLWENNPENRPLRRVLIPKYPYVVYFEILATEILIVAVSHASRSPGHWLGRLKEGK